MQIQIIPKHCRKNGNEVFIVFQFVDYSQYGLFGQKITLTGTTLSEIKAEIITALKVKVTNVLNAIEQNDNFRTQLTNMGVNIIDL